jgi:hypothetical protein
MAQRAKVEGVVSKTWTKTKSTKYGDKVIHYCEVDGTTFETGFKKVFQDGESIKATVEWKYGGWQYVQNVVFDDTLPPPSRGNGNQGNFSKGNGSNYGKGSFPINPKDGQISIIRQSSLSRALETLALRDGDFDSQDDLIKEVLRIALIYTDFASGNDIMRFGGDDDE